MEPLIDLSYLKVALRAGLYPFSPNASSKHPGLNTPSTGKPQTKPLKHAITYHTRANWFPRQSWLSLYVSLLKNRLPFSIA